jgi:hypothetical protein
LLSRQKYIQRVEVASTPLFCPFRRFGPITFGKPESCDSPRPPVSVWSGAERIGVFLPDLGFIRGLFFIPQNSLRRWHLNARPVRVVFIDHHHPPTICHPILAERGPAGESDEKVLIVKRFAQVADEGRELFGDVVEPSVWIFAVEWR